MSELSWFIGIWNEHKEKFFQKNWKNRKWKEKIFDVLWWLIWLILCPWFFENEHFKHKRNILKDWKLKIFYNKIKNKLSKIRQNWCSLVSKPNKIPCSNQVASSFHNRTFVTQTKTNSFQFWNVCCLAGYCLYLSLSRLYI